MKFFVGVSVLLFLLNPVVAAQMMPLIIGLAVMTRLALRAVKLYMAGKPLAIMGYQVLSPKIDQITQSAQRSVQEGPIQSGFAAQLAFPAPALLILFAVTGVRL